MLAHAHTGLEESIQQTQQTRMLTLCLPPILTEISAEISSNSSQTKAGGGVCLKLWSMYALQTLMNSKLK